MTNKKRDEAELARYFDERKGDMSLWAEQPAKIRVRRGGASSVFSVRFTPQELKLLQGAADRRSITISKLIRDAALRESLGSPQVGDLTEVADALRQLADLISSRSDDRPTDMDEKMARSFVAGKTYRNVARPVEPPLLGQEREHGSATGEQEQYVRAGRTRPKKD